MVDYIQVPLQTLMNCYYVAWNGKSVHCSDLENGKDDLAKIIKVDNNHVILYISKVEVFKVFYWINLVWLIFFPTDTNF